MAVAMIQVMRRSSISRGGGLIGRWGRLKASMGQTAGGKWRKSRQGPSQGVWCADGGMLRRLVGGAAVGRHITALPSASLLYRLETDSALAADGPARSGPARSSRASHPRWLQAVLSQWPARAGREVPPRRSR